MKQHYVMGTFVADDQANWTKRITPVRIEM
jgi:hypothetical protein